MLVLLSILPVLALAALGNSSDPLVVSTNVGTYQGLYSSPTVRNWLGIRYGKPTNGSLRFMNPQRSAVLPADSIYNASSFSPSCYQYRSSGPSYGDDCLSLNIWSPALNRTNSSSEGATVLLWIYGGGYTGGSSALPLYNGNNFVRDQDDIVVVTINYRLSLWGFPAGSGIPDPLLNPGLKDQRLAVEWVYNNIRNFGGDPSKITLFGESAGAESIGAYAYTYAEDPIARAFIFESGSEFLNAGTSVAVNSSASATGWQAVAAQVGCNVTDQAAQLKCMQNANGTALSAAVNAYSSAGTAFLPTANGVTLLQNSEYQSRGLSGQFAQVPVLIGTNNNEGTTLVSSYANGATGLAPILTLLSFTCPAAVVAGDRTNSSLPAWQYRYFGTWPNITPPNSTLLSFHSSEIALVFGNYNSSTTYPVSRAEVQTSQTMQSAWAAFAKNPTTGLTEYGWPQYEANGTTLIQLAFNYFNQSQAVLDAAAYPIVTFNNSQAYNSGC